MKSFKKYDRKEYIKEWARNNRDKTRPASKVHSKNHKEYYQNEKFQSRYGITLKDYNKMVADQNGLCKICGLPPADKRKRLCVDHDHATGKIRGLLCRHCNNVIGMARDNITVLIKAIEYLKS